MLSIRNIPRNFVIIQGYSLSVQVACLATLLTISFAVGYLFIHLPLLPIVAAGGGVFILLCFRRPQLALLAFLFVHVAVPVYIRIPPIGPVPPMPIGLAMLAVLAAVSLVSPHIRSEDRAFRGPAWTLWQTILVFAAISLLSLVDERTTGDSINMWLKAILFPIALSLTVARVFGGAVDIDRAFRVMLLAAFIISLYAIAEFIFQSNPLLDTFLIQTGKEWSGLGDHARIDEFRYRSFSVFSQPIEFATCVGMILPYAIIRMSTTSSGSERLLLLVVCMVCFMGIFASLSRTAVMAIILACVLIAPFIPSLQRILVAGAGAAVIGLVIAWPWIGTAILNRLSDIDNLTIRLKLWETALAIFQDHPIRGAGFGNFPEYQFEAVRRHQLGPFYEFAGSIDSIGVAENTYVQLAAETGLLGMASMAAVIFAFFLLIFRLARSPLNVLHRNLAFSVGAGGLVYCANAVTITAYTHFTITMVLAGVMFPFAMVLHREAHRATDATPVDEK